ncbi:hypothetical protein JW905_05265, partial [bacterium]|nr:hypothetical protein [candidate division CSSED10-310 bacterium]
AIDSYWLVTDPGSILDHADGTTDICIMDNGTPSVVISNGGCVNVYNGRLCANTSGKKGTALVTGSGSTWTNKNDLRIPEGASCYGKLTIAAGGRVRSNNGYMGQGADSTGLVVIAGSGSMWTNTGELKLTWNAGSVGALRFEADANGVGTIGVGGQLTVDSNDRLEVDISNYNRANGLKLVLVTYGSKSGAFDNIAVTGLDGGAVDQEDDNRIVLNVVP